MAEKGRLLAIGALFLDTVYHVDDAFLQRHALSKGSNASIELEELHRLAAGLQSQCLLQKGPGGSAANVIRGLARQRWRCGLCAKGSDDAKAAFLREDFATYGIDLVLSPGDLPTGEAIAFVTPDGERTMRCYLGASGSFDPDEFDAAICEGATLLHVEGYAICNAGLVEKARAAARQYGVPMSFDLANYELVITYRDRLLALVEEGVDLLFANEQEAHCLLGMTAPETAATMARHSTVAVVTQAAKGCWVASAGGRELFHSPALPVDDIVDSTGAGDLFTAGFLDGFLRGTTLAQAAAHGALLASVVIRHPGAVIPAGLWDSLRLR